MHVNTHLKPESEGKTGKGIYLDGMVEHDGHVGLLLKKLDDLGIADNTIVVYTSDNGAEVMTCRTAETHRSAAKRPRTGRVAIAFRR
jgi:arylsulfatase A-like enzyme